MGLYSEGMRQFKKSVFFTSFLVLRDPNGQALLLLDRCYDKIPGVLLPARKLRA
jgi:hypothetical protein